MKGERQVLDSHEESGRVDTWTEHLCVSRLDAGMARLEVCGHEVLDEFNGRDEDGNEVEPPSELDGVPVRLEHGYLVSERLVLVNDDRFFDYDASTVAQAFEWVERHSFQVTDAIRNAIINTTVELPH